MAIRIYALAKQLRVEHKKLVDVCKDAGIVGKGSALASLSDEEVEVIKDHLRRPGKAAKPAPAVPEGPVRQAPTTVASGRVPVIEEKPTPPPAPEVAAEPPAKPAAPAAPTTPAVESPTPPPPSITPAIPAAAVQRGDYIGPGGVGIPDAVRPEALACRADIVCLATAVLRPALNNHGEHGEHGELRANHSLENRTVL